MYRDDRSEAEVEALLNKLEYYKSGIKGWKMAVVDLLPDNCSLAFRIKVEEFLDSIKNAV